MSGEKVMLGYLTPAVAQSVGLGAIIAPIAVPVLAGVAIWGLSRWFSSRQKRSQNQFQQAQTLKTPIRDLEMEANKHLQRQQQEFQTAVLDAEKRQQAVLQRESERLQENLKSGLAQQRSEYLEITRTQRQEYNKLIVEQESKFTALIETERLEREQKQQLLQQQMTELQQTFQDQSQIAQDLLVDVESIWDSIDQNYQHHRFAPGRLEDLKRGLAIARSNIQAGVSQSAIAITQQTYLDLVDLRLELEKKEQEWLLLYNATMSNLGVLLAQVKANQQCKVWVGEDNEAECFSVDVDRWSHGNLSKYEQELKQIELQLQQGESTLTIEDVRTISEQIIRLEPELKEITEQAKRAILSSQLRAEIADKVVEVLETLGFEMENSERDAGYEGNDQRASYMVKVKNLAGEEVVSVITPEHEFGSNSISINTFSPTFIDERATRQNAEAIFEALDQEGIKGRDSLKCNPEARSEYRDVSAAKQRIPSVSSYQKEQKQA